MAETAERILAGEDWWFAVRELLDGLSLVHVIDPAPPAPVSPQVDAVLAAVVEHLCAGREQPAPSWVLDDSRFLEQFWWPDGQSGVRGALPRGVTRRVPAQGDLHRRDHAVPGLTLDRAIYQTQVLDLPGLRVEVASPEVVLVMKCLAHRVQQDDRDVEILARMLGLDSADAVLDLVERMARARLLTPQVQFFVEAVLDRGAA